MRQIWAVGESLESRSRCGHNRILGKVTLGLFHGLLDLKDLWQVMFWPATAHGDTSIIKLPPI